MEFRVDRILPPKQFGNIVSAPQEISGGLLHRMFEVTTETGKYAVKQLNPDIMRRKEAVGNYIKSEQVAYIASKHLPALPARIINECALQTDCGHYYLIFDWTDGKSLTPAKVTEVHSEKMGTILGKLHSLNLSNIGIEHEPKVEIPSLIKWEVFLEKGRELQVGWLANFENLIQFLHQWSRIAGKARKEMPANTVISHRDLDLKNVLWNQEGPILIDWESAGLISPLQDMVETAVYWSSNAKKEINKTNFRAFLTGYNRHAEIPETDWKIILYSALLPRLEWLEFNLKRGLQVENKKEQALGAKQVEQTLVELRQYASSVDDMIDWLTYFTRGGITG